MLFGSSEYVTIHTLQVFRIFQTQFPGTRTGYSFHFKKRINRRGHNGNYRVTKNRNITHFIRSNGKIILHCVVDSKAISKEFQIAPTGPITNLICFERYLMLCMNRKLYVVDLGENELPLSLFPHLIPQYSSIISVKNGAENEVVVLQTNGLFSIGYIPKKE